MMPETITLARSAAAPYQRPPWIKRPPVCPHCRRIVRNGDLAIVAKTETREFGGSGYKVRDRQQLWTVTHKSCMEDLS